MKLPLSHILQRCKGNGIEDIKMKQAKSTWAEPTWSWERISYLSSTIRDGGLGSGEAHWGSFQMTESSPSRHKTSFVWTSSKWQFPKMHSLLKQRVWSLGQCSLGALDPASWWMSSWGLVEGLLNHLLGYSPALESSDASNWTSRKVWRSGKRVGPCIHSSPCCRMWENLNSHQVQCHNFTDQKDKEVFGQDHNGVVAEVGMEPALIQSLCFSWSGASGSPHR